MLSNGCRRYQVLELGATMSGSKRAWNIWAAHSKAERDTPNSSNLTGLEEIWTISGINLEFGKRAINLPMLRPQRAKIYLTALPIGSVFPL